MTDCHHIDSLVTPYVDDDISPADREAVDRHLRVCWPCRSRVHAEQSVRALIRSNTPSLDPVGAPPALRARCRSLAAPPLQVGTSAYVAPGIVHRRLSRPWRSRVVPALLAASLVLIVGEIGRASCRERVYVLV